MSQPAETTSEHLLQAIGQGDAQALAVLYDRCAPRLFCLILQILKNRSDAEDVLQDTFLQVWQQAIRYDPRLARPDVWLLMLARSRSLDRLRKMQSIKRLLASSATTASASPSASEAAGLAEDRVAVCSALCTLNPEQQEPIHLAFYEGLTHVEIAQQLDLPLGTIKTRIRTGMQRLHSVLTPVGEP